jgi:TfoX/Sxy family transcriptional regulator of competence genes
METNKEADKMAYNDELARRIRRILSEAPGLVEKKMFGGIGFLYRGNMAIGVLKNSLLVRTGPERYEEALRKPNTRPFDMTGKPMKGWVAVDPPGYEDDPDLEEWIGWGMETARQLPAK